ncbi:hypothetical protein [Pedobacter alluvionis]|uniref:Uncharacterized protein n=1 Tax=Pedobacter alluvionis TaxID=475253 RepID=A0A497YFN9_9SPHI|nr:hypothetical protein [Pedobacter alluvionis]RLJ80219.1 hypothetical protein BCL90_0969 [Pedobacter alluvionis]
MKNSTKKIEKFDLENLSPLDANKMKNILGGNAVVDPPAETELSVTGHRDGSPNTVDH